MTTFAKDDRVYARTEAGQVIGRVVQARPGDGQDADAVLQILTEPSEGHGGGQLITVYAGSCALIERANQNAPQTEGDEDGLSGR